MKRIIFYSPDFSLCTNLIMYLQNDFLVTSTTDLEILKTVIFNSKLDLVLIDSEPDASLQLFLKEVKALKPDITIILTYVYKQKMHDLDNSIRKYVSSVFYKPYDLNEVTKKLALLTLN